MRAAFLSLSQASGGHELKPSVWTLEDIDAMLNTAPSTADRLQWEFIRRFVVLTHMGVKRLVPSPDSVALGEVGGFFRSIANKAFIVVLFLETENDLKADL